MTTDARLAPSRFRPLNDPRRLPVPAAPRIRALSHADSLALLRRNIVGRLAFSFRDRVDILPMHYVYADDWLFLRTSPGRKITIIEHSPWVAFEIDEVAGIFEWQSVVVHGTAYRPRANQSAAGRRFWEDRRSLLTRLIPETGSAVDPVPFRTMVVGIHVRSISGRGCSRAPSRRP